jgi:hypothetical protein
VYDGGSIIDNGQDVCLADGNNFLVVGSTLLMNGAYAIYILMLNAYGDTIWTRIIGGYGSGQLANAVVNTADGGFVLTGDADTAFAVKINSFGNIVWHKKYGGRYVQCYDIKNTIDGGYIACGSTEYDNGYVLKIDSTGEMQWQRTFPTNGFMTFSSVDLDSDSGYVVAGYINEHPQDTSKAYLVKIDKNGEPGWFNKFRVSNNFTSITTVINLTNGYLLGVHTLDLHTNYGKLFIARTDDSGNVYFIKDFNNTQSEYFKDMKVLNNNKYVYAISRDSAQAYALNGKAMITDSLGNILHDRIYHTPDFIELYSVLPISNGDFIFVGSADFDLPTNTDVYALRTDSVLNAPPLIGVEKTTEVIARRFMLHQNIPNPFNPETFITCELNKASHVLVKVYDILGREIAHLIDKIQVAGKYTVKFDGSNLASGMYFYQLLIDGMPVDTKKMVLLK